MHRQISRFALAMLAAAAVIARAEPGGGIMRLDSDGDGLVSSAEFQLPESHRGLRMLDRADSDGDGSVTRDEVLAAVDEAAEERRSRMSGHMLLMFEEADSDGDGVLTPEEARAHAFARLDADGDGYVTEAEAQQMRDRRKDRRERHGPRE